MFVGMSEKSLQELAEESVESTLSAGQSISQGDMSVSKANLAQAHEIMTQEEDRAARKSGRRPFLRNIDISRV